MTNVLCIYHADCADGLGAAWAVHRALGDKVDFVAAKYGEEPQLSVECKYHSTSGPCTDCLDTGYELGGGPFLGRDVLIVDFSYPLETLRAMAREARSVLVLDHHKTAQEDLAELLLPIEWNYWISPGGVNGRLAAIFDLARSGAGITWDYLMGGPRSPLINLIEDRDLWRFRLADSRAFHAVLTSYDIGDLPAMFELMDDWQDYLGKDQCVQTSPQPWSELMAEGQAILRAQERAVAAAVAGTRRTMRIGGYVVPVANVPNAMASDAGHLLCSETPLSVYKPTDVIGKYYQDYTVTVPFSATYYDGADGKRHFSLRSPPGGADVGVIAKRYGGGGHEHAAGFNMPIGWEGE